jgi:hypothetical protein
MVAVRASAGAFDLLKSRGRSLRLAMGFEIVRRGLIRDLSNAGGLKRRPAGPMGENSDDPEELARTDPTEQAAGHAWF